MKQPAEIIHHQSPPNKTLKHIHRSLYKTWRSMKGRCQNSKSRWAKNYVGRGIGVCCGFRNSFVLFRNTIGDKPTPRHSIDRIENGDGYWCGGCEECVENGWPLNIRWATEKEQQRNTRANKVLMFNGKSMCVAGWAEFLGMQPIALYNRILRGWPIERALTEPIQTRSTNVSRYC